MNDSYITPSNKKPIIIDKTGFYIMRNGEKVIIDKIEPNNNKSVTRFNCSGRIERLFRGKWVFKGFNIWHESGDFSGFESEFDIVNRCFNVGD